MSEKKKPQPAQPAGAQSSPKAAREELVRVRLLIARCLRLCAAERSRQAGELAAHAAGMSNGQIHRPPK